MTSGFFQTNAMPRLVVAIRGMVGLQDGKGDWHTRQQIEHYFDLVTEVSQANGSIVSSYENDSAFITFANSKKALGASKDILNKLMDEEANKHDGEGDTLDATTKVVPLSIRMGLHHGPLNVDVGVLSGPVMDMTKKMVARAKPSQIVATSDFVSQLADDSVETKPLGVVNDGDHKVETFEIITEHSGTVFEAESAIAPEGVASAPVQTQARLNFLGTEMIACATQPVVVMGRELSNDLVVNVETASRQHARVEFVNGSFVISDHSTNGTYVQPAGGQPIFLNQQQIPLTGSGVISLGQPVVEGAQLIQYGCV
jgi:adenylate cyclase